MKHVETLILAIKEKVWYRANYIVIYLTFSDTRSISAQTVCCIYISAKTLTHQNIDLYGGQNFATKITDAVHYTAAHSYYIGLL